MDPSTEAALRQYYADLFGIEQSAVWQGTTVQRHVGRLGGYEGFYVAWRADGVHVSTPTEVDPDSVSALMSERAATLQDPNYWRRFAQARGLRVIGPSTHAYLDRDPGAVDSVSTASDVDLRSLRETVQAADWTESGWDDAPPYRFGIRQDGRLVAASNLTLFHHRPRDIGVLVAPSVRGLGLSLPVAQHAASVAIRTHRFALWGARDSNAASVATSRRLGFDRWCSQLAVR
jgi:hypothetical protein